MRFIVINNPLLFGFVGYKPNYWYNNGYSCLNKESIHSGFFKKSI